MAKQRPARHNKAGLQDVNCFLYIYNGGENAHLYSRSCEKIPPRFQDVWLQLVARSWTTYICWKKLHCFAGPIYFRVLVVARKPKDVDTKAEIQRPGGQQDVKAIRPDLETKSESLKLVGLEPELKDK